MTPNFKTFLVVAAVILAMLVPSCVSAHPDPTPELEALCEEEGGCVYASRKKLIELLMQAHATGKTEARMDCRSTI
jgi:hypothetical protein